MSPYHTSSRHYTVFPLTQSIQARPLQDSKACGFKMECRISDFGFRIANPKEESRDSGVSEKLVHLVQNEPYYDSPQLLELFHIEPHVFKDLD